MILFSIVSIFQSNWFSPKLLFLCSVHLNTLHIRMFSDPPSESELFCFHLDRLTRDHWRRCLTGSSSGRRSQALESSHQSGVRQDHKWLLQVSVSSVPSLVSLEMVWGIYPFQALCECWWGPWLSNARASSLTSIWDGSFRRHLELFDRALGSLCHWKSVFIEVFYQCSTTHSLKWLGLCV